MNNGHGVDQVDGNHYVRIPQNTYIERLTAELIVVETQGRQEE